MGQKDSKSHGMSWHQPFEGRDAAAFLAPPPRRPGLVVGTRAVEVRKMVDDGGEIV